MKKKILSGILSAAVFSGIVFSAAVSAADMGAIEAAIMQKDYQAAIVAAENYLAQHTEKNEDYYQAQYYLALSRLNIEDYPNARTLFREIVHANPNPAQHDRAYLGMFNSYYLQGEYEEALDIAKRLLDASPQSEFLSLIHLKIARANMKLARWSQARTHLKIIINKFPNSFEKFTAEKLIQEKQYFTVQVGAFMDRNKAESLLRDLKKHGEYVYILETKDRAEISFYRVRVGKLAKLDEAEDLRKKLASQGYPALIYP